MRGFHVVLVALAAAAAVLAAEPGHSAYRRHEVIRDVPVARLLAIAAARHRL